MACNKPHPDFILKELSSEQYTECLAYYKVEPVGQDMLFYMLGQISSMVYNTNRTKKSPAKGPWDFVPIVRTKKKQTQDEIKNLFMALANAGKEDNKPKKKAPLITITKRRRKREKLAKLNKKED